MSSKAYIMRHMSGEIGGQAKTRRQQQAGRKAENMGKIKAFSSNTGIDDTAIVVERTDDFYHSAKQLSDFIRGLSLSNVDNDRLIALTMQQIRDAEQGGFNTGFRMGVQFAESR